MGVNPAKKITKYHKKELAHKVLDLHDSSLTWINFTTASLNLYIYFQMPNGHSDNTGHLYVDEGENICLLEPLMINVLLLIIYCK